MSNEDDNKLIAERRRKLGEWREAGQDFPNDVRRDHQAAELHQQLAESTAESLAEKPIPVTLAGRMMSKRVMGKASFSNIQDMSGRMQLFVQRDRVGEDIYKEYKTWDVGDIIFAAGEMFRTKTDELSVKVDEIRLVTKSLRPLPEKWHGLTDTEQRYRQRYVDLIMNPESRRVYDIRSKTIAYIRDFLNRRGFVEVETPMLQPIPGGATAKPFVTHYNALDRDFYLRIAPELYLKRLVVGGFEQVFEINRNFRNEGVSTRHNPEFTMLEFYQAYEEYQGLMDLTEVMLRGLTHSVLGATAFSSQGQDYDFAQPFRRVSVRDAVLEADPSLNEAQIDDVAYLENVLKENKLPVPKGAGAGKLLIELFEAFVEPNLIQPTFVTAYPTEVSPLARRNNENPEVTDRFELFIGGRELANGFSELNDPEDQAARFRAQVEAKEGGDDEAMFYDDDYIRALEYGMPPTAGEGIGIDRLVMLLTDSASIRDVLLFPQLRPES